MANKLCKDLESCKIPCFFITLGKKWTFPVFCKLHKNQTYSFEEIIKMTDRKVHRATISNLLKQLIELTLIKKIDSKYQLTENGINVKNNIKNMALILEPNKKCHEIIENEYLEKNP